MQVANGSAVDVTAFDLDNDALELLFSVVDVVDDAVDAVVFTLFAFAGIIPSDGLGADQGERPPLELVAVTQGQVASAGKVSRLALNCELDAGEHFLHAPFDEGDGEVGDVDADPATVELFGGGDGGTAAAEGVKDDVAGVGGSLEDALEEGEGFLGGIA